MQIISLGILSSTRGTAMQAIIDAIAKNQLPAEIKIIISNKKNAPILERAQQQGLQQVFLDPAGLDREAYDDQLTTLLQQNSVDLIVLIGYMRILSEKFVRQWQQRIINVHPPLLPEFAGGMDRAVHQAVLTAGKTQSGCTVHYVTEDVDAGPQLIQKTCPVLPADTVDSLKTRVQALEGEALIEAILKISNGKNYES